MFFQTIKKAVSAGLGTKIIFIVVLLLSTISIFLSSYFIAEQKKILTTELHARIRSLGQNYINDSLKYIISGTFENMFQLSVGLEKEKDILAVKVIDSKRIIRASSYYSLIGSKFFMPSGDSLVAEGWFPTGNKNVMELIIPIRIDRRTVSTDSILNSTNTGMGASSKYINNIFHFPFFSPDSKSIMFSSFYDGFNYVGIYAVDINTFTPRLLIDEGSHSSWSHDGRYIAFIPFASGKLSIYDTETKETRKICEKPEGRRGVPCFTPDDRYVITTFQTDPGDIDTERLFKIPVEGGETEQLTFHDGQHWYPDCSPDGKYIIYTDFKNSLLYVYYSETGKSFRVFPELKASNRCGSFSPDGRKICYLLNEKNGNEIFITDIDFSKIPPKGNINYSFQLTHTGGYKWLTDWSPDGKWITYLQEKNRKERPWDIYIVPSMGGEAINLTESLLKKESLGYVIIDFSTEELNMAISRETRVAVFITLLMLGIGVLGSILLVRNLVNPVHILADATRAVARGDLDQTVPVIRNDEIGILADSFNMMTRQLKQSREEIEEWNLELEKKIEIRTSELNEKTSELEQQHRVLENAYKELDTLDKAKDDFLSLVSHELRTPLSSLLVFSEMLLNGIVSSEETRTEIHKTMVDECKRLSRLISDVLDLAKIEAGRMPFHIQTINIRGLISDTLSRLNPIITRKGIHIDYTHVPIDVFLRGDSDKIIQVLENIVSNALKFTPEQGTISFSLTTDKDECILAVRDTGKGIKKEDIPKVFDRFSQLENIDRHRGGTGLGMAISKSIIERLGGRIWIESEEGRGTTVFFSLKRKESSEKENLIGQDEDSESVVQDIPLKNLQTDKILLVDDEKAIRFALKECLKTLGLESLEASEGREALRIARNQRPALIILDVMIPDISGLEVCRTLKNDPETSGIKIIILSAKGQEKEKKEGLEAGADRYITKPFSYEQLGREIKELLIV
jgi:signal transduction histidine kinase/CheY-like chemotaxis protein